MKTKSSSSLQIRVYSPEPALKHTGVFFRDMFKDIAASGELAMALARPARCGSNHGGVRANEGLRV